MLYLSSIASCSIYTTSDSTRKPMNTMVSYRTALNSFCLVTAVIFAQSSEGIHTIAIRAAGAGNHEADIIYAFPQSK